MPESDQGMTTSRRRHIVNRAAREIKPEQIIAIRNQRRKASGCICVRTAWPMNMPATEDVDGRDI
jgi:hypothetical protein